MKDKQYKLVIRQRRNVYWAFYVPIEDEPVYILGNAQASAKTIREVLKKARKFKPEDGDIAYTYLDRNSN